MTHPLFIGLNHLAASPAVLGLFMILDNPVVVMLLGFLAVVLGVMGAYSTLADLLLRDRWRVSQRVDDTFRERIRDRARKSELFKDLRFEVLDDEEQPDDADPGLRRRFKAMVDQSGLNLTPARLLAMMAAGGLAVMAVTLLAGLHPAIGASLAVLGVWLPWLFVRLKQKARLLRLLGQLPDAFDLMARVVRAGQTIPQAMQAVADEFDQPIAAEFALCYEQQNLGLPPERALRDLGRRTGLIEIKIFVLALLVQQQTGGNLSELLEKLATTVRERFRVRGKVKTVTAEGRLQAILLLALPPALFFFIVGIDPTYGKELLEHPFLLGGTVVLQIAGAIWIRNIVNFHY